MYHFTKKTSALRRILAICAGLVCIQGAQAQLKQSALDYLLQKPPVAKHFDDKKFGDHIFFEAGLGLNARPSREKAITDPGVQANVAFGDWVTPTHGWRFGVRAGTYKWGTPKAKALSLSGDYLLNLTSLASPSYQTPRHWEWYGIAGLDVNLSHYDESTTKSMGVHLGLRSQYNVGDYTYLYIEPQAGLQSDKLYHVNSWRKFRPMGSIQAGVGYRLIPGVRKHRADTTDGHWLSRCFVEIAGGPSFIANSTPKSWDDRMGMRVQASLGKFFDPYNALRLTASLAAYRQRPYDHARGAMLSAGYMLNLHNLIGGYEPNRRYSVNAVADLNLGLSTSGKGRKTSYGFGGGLQANLGIAPGIGIFLEPRVDFMHGTSGGFAPELSSVGNWDIVPSILLGLGFAHGTQTYSQLARNKDFEQQTPYDHLFVDAGLGITEPWTRHTMGHPTSNLRPKAFLGIGKWWDAYSGTRIWLEAQQLETANLQRYKTFSIGADYLWHISNTLHGYDPNRATDVFAAVGVNASKRSAGGGFFFGGNIGVRGIWNINKMWGLYLEPQVRIYNNNYLPNSSFGRFNTDITAAAILGVQVNLRDYLPSLGWEAYDKDDRHNFFSVAGGVGTSAVGASSKEYWGVGGRVSFGHRYSPVSAWRVNLTGYENNINNRRYARGMIGADYMADLTTLGKGYDTDHAVRLRALAGLDLGADYKQGGKPHFISEVHVGGQLGVRLSSRFELYVEPQAAYVMGGGHKSSRQRLEGRGYLGLNYAILSGNTKGNRDVMPERNHFFSFGIGTGAHTGTVATMSPKRRKFTTDFSANYGQWVNAVSGWRAGLSTSTIQMYGKHNRQITSIHGDYLFNVLTLCGGADRLDSNWLLNGSLGASLNFASRKGESARFAPGLRAAAQVGYNVSDNWQLYLEPNISVTSKRIWRGTGHPAEGNVGIQLGTAYRF